MVGKTFDDSHSLSWAAFDDSFYSFYIDGQLVGQSLSLLMTLEFGIV